MRQLYQQKLVGENTPSVALVRQCFNDVVDMTALPMENHQRNFMCRRYMRWADVGRCDECLIDNLFLFIIFDVSFLQSISIRSLKLIYIDKLTYILKLNINFTLY